MHDIDRTQLEFGAQQEGMFETEQFGEFEEYEGEWSGEGEEELFSEAEEAELAAELLSVSNEAELEQFLGNLIKKVGQVAGRVVRSPIGQAIVPVLKSAAGKALPLAGAALGGYVGGPLGAKIGSGVASAAGKALGLEAEGVSLEDREFEGAKQFVKLAAETVKNATSATGANPRAVAQQAVIAAARKHAPALVSGGGAGSQASQMNGGSGGRQGRWIRKGRNIILLGV